MFDHVSAKRFRLSLRQSLPSPLQVLVRAADLLATWEGRARDRQRLAHMSEYLLKDLGISRADARSESDKPLWRV